MLKSWQNKAICFFLIFSFALISFSFIFATEALAQYNPGDPILSNIGCSGPDCQFCNLVKGVNNLLEFLIYAGAIIAVCMFVYAGVKLVFSNGNKKALDEGKDILWHVVVGFLVTICAFLIIDFIMKGLVSDDFEANFGPWNEIQCVEKSMRNAEPIIKRTPPANTALEQCTRNALTNNTGITIPKNACPAGVRYQDVPGGCTSVSGLPVGAVQALITLKRSCLACDVVVTGGTEAGHDEHGAGKPIVDLRINGDLGTYLLLNSTKSGNRTYKNSKGENVYVINGNEFTHETEGVTAHYHVVLNSGNNTQYQCN